MEVLTLQCLAVRKRSHILKQTCGFHLQVLLLKIQDFYDMVPLSGTKISRNSFQQYQLPNGGNLTVKLCDLICNMLIPLASLKTMILWS